MDKIIKFFKQWDKLAHTFVSCALMLIFTAVASIKFPDWASLLVGTGLTALCAFGKELYDSKQEGDKFDWMDILADGIGFAVALIPLIIIMFV